MGYIGRLHWREGEGGAGRFSEGGRRYIRMGYMSDLGPLKMSVTIDSLMKSQGSPNAKPARPAFDFQKNANTHNN